MGREGRAADNWGALSFRSVEMIFSETERWGAAVLQSAWRAG